jgi:anti-anti-sigma factor
MLVSDQSQFLTASNIDLEVDGDVIIVAMDQILAQRHTERALRSLCSLTTQTRKLVLNLAHVQTLDLPACGQLIVLLREMRRHGGEMVLCHVDRRVLVVLELIRAHRVFPVCATVAEALHMLSRA